MKMDYNQPDNEVQKIILL